jgi:cell fate (sporulation/competence/biofilm development) regulator YmcA (YheA/YmcA/DUF963 family)
MIMIPVSVGEVLDKISILEIKSERISDVQKLINICAELDHLLASAKEYRHPTLESELKKVNESLWEIEDRIRAKEHLQEFDNEFINLARLVYITNDKRADIKREINKAAGSELVEEKFYTVTDGSSFSLINSVGEV